MAQDCSNPNRHSRQVCEQGGACSFASVSSSVTKAAPGPAGRPTSPLPRPRSKLFAKLLRKELKSLGFEGHANVPTEIYVLQRLLLKLLFATVSSSRCILTNKIDFPMRIHLEVKSPLMPPTPWPPNSRRADQCAWASLPSCVRNRTHLPTARGQGPLLWPSTSGLLGSCTTRRPDGLRPPWPAPLASSRVATRGDESPVLLP